MWHSSCGTAVLGCVLRGTMNFGAVTTMLLDLLRNTAGGGCATNHKKKALRVSAGSFLACHVQRSHHRMHGLEIHGHPRTLGPNRVREHLPDLRRMCEDS